MENRRRARKRKIQKNRLLISALILGMSAICLAAYGMGYFSRQEEAPRVKGQESSKSRKAEPEELLISYMAHIPAKEYEEMYEMLDVEASGGILPEDFIRRNSAIYEGMETQDMEIEVTGYDKKQKIVSYHTSFHTVAGEVKFENQASFTKQDGDYRIIWEDSLIFPQLQPSDVVRVSTMQPKRGKILDRNGNILAGKGTATSVQVVPSQFVDKESAIQEIAGLLGMKPEVIKKKLEEPWIEEDSTVPLKTVPKISGREWESAEPDESVRQEEERQEKLLAIPGVVFEDVEIREYPLEDAAAHLVGYVQNVTEEDLTEHAEEGYTADSVIGKSGAEALFEKKLRGKAGRRIYIANETGYPKEEIASIMVRHGEDVQLTIDAQLQEQIYQQYQKDKSCTVAMDPYTGEILALTSTPSYDNNTFVLGVPGDLWTSFNENPDKPLFNRFRQSWCPGSVFKPIVAAIGMESGAIDPELDYGNEGTSWQKDKSWGSYYVTTLHECNPGNLDNAMMHSDNIYFAKAALNIGKDTLQNGLQKAGFGEEIPFEIGVSKAQYSNTEEIESEIQLADSGYGQGQVLINPLHLASLYSAFCNGGNAIKPYLTLCQEPQPEYWKQNLFPQDVANRILKSLELTVTDPEATGHGVYRPDVALAGKTGTAEVKSGKEDKSGTELGWFAVFTQDKTQERPFLLVTMAEDVKDRHGSGYVGEKTAKILEYWYGPLPQPEGTKDPQEDSDPAGAENPEGAGQPESDSPPAGAEEETVREPEEDRGEGTKEPENSP